MMAPRANDVSSSTSSEFQLLDSGEDPAGPPARLGLSRGRSRRCRSLYAAAAALLLFLTWRYEQQLLAASSYSSPSLRSSHDQLQRCLSNPFASPGYLTASTTNATANCWNTFVPGCTPPSYIPQLRARSPELEWLRGRTIALPGVSVERIHLSNFCAAINGNYTTVDFDDELSGDWNEEVLGQRPDWIQEPVLNRGSASPHMCRIHEFDFVMVQTFHYGLGVVRELQGHSSDVKPWFGPSRFEDRLETWLLPILSKLGRSVDLVEMGGHEWDMMSLIGQSKYRNTDLYPNPSSIYADIITDSIPGYLTRLPEIATYLRQTFPSAPIIWRTPHDIPLRNQPQPRVSAALDQVLRQVFEAPEWEGKVILDESTRWFTGTGATEWMQDQLHIGMYPGAFVWGDHLLYQLHKAIEPEL